MKRVTGLACLLGSAAFLAACGQDRDDEPPAATSSQAVEADEAAPALAPVTPVDYSSASTWLCRPDTADACEQVATATSIAGDGKLTKDAFAPNAAAPIDCFYVYPTVSRDETPNSDTTPGVEELEVARQQLARFGTVCRLYAPMYRQVTLPALRQLLAGERPATNREMAYADVKAAWDHYLSADNAGRGVVLIGHSQGAGLLTRLIAAEIDGKPAQDRLVSALLIGTNLAVANPHEGGGSFREIRLCQSATDTRCAISYVSFRASTPPPANSLFGKADEEGMHAACVNPAELDGSGGQLKALLPAASRHESMAAPLPWTTDGAAIDTPFVMLPGMLSARCVNQGGYSYLAVNIASDPADKRTDGIVGDVVTNGEIQPGWGLHLIDMNLALGNLVDVVKRQGEAWTAAHPAAQAALPKPQ
jgi:hypothetical protein